MKRLQNVKGSLISNHVYDYLILGGGISGLQCAQIFTLKTKNILILQAQNNLGGRIKSLSVTDLPASKKIDWLLSKQQHFKKVKIQKGATWIEERHVVLRQMCKRYGIPMKVQFAQGSATYLAQKTYTSKQLLEHQVYGPQIYKFLEEIDELAEEYRVHVLDNDKITDKYKEMLQKYDPMTLEEYLVKNIKTKEVRDFIQNFLEHTECISADVNSMHEVLAKHGRSNDIGILKEFLGTEEHEASYLIEGTQFIIQKMIQSIEKNLKSHIDDILKLNSEVIDVDNIQNDVTVVTYLQKQTSLPVKVFAKKVICAVPLQVVRNINFTQISENKRIVFDNQLRTNALKTFIVLRKAIWRDKQKSGDGLFSYEWLGNMCHDISPEDQSCGILVIFHNGKKYYEWKNRFGLKGSYEQKLAYMKKMISKFCDIEEGTPEYIENFSDCFIGESSFMQNQFIRSGFQSNTRPGTFARILQRGGDLSALYGDQKNVYFVGSEFSDSFASYIEGAIRISRKKAFKLINMEDPLQGFIEKVNIVTKH